MLSVCLCYMRISLKHSAVELWLLLDASRNSGFLIENWLSDTRVDILAIFRSRLAVVPFCRDSIFVFWCWIKCWIILCCDSCEAEWHSDCTVQEVMYLSAVLTMKRGESQDKVINLLNKTIELHLGTVQVYLILMILYCVLYFVILTIICLQNWCFISLQWSERANQETVIQWC